MYTYIFLYFLFSQQNNQRAQMIKKSKISKYTVPRLLELTNSETHPQNILTCIEVMKSKNDLLNLKKEQLKLEIEQFRGRMQKASHEMSQGTKDRIQKKTKKVMDKNSRPQPNEIKELADMFTYMENQSTLTNRNTTRLDQIVKQIQLNNNLLKQKASISQDSSDLDQQFYQLHEECARQQKVRQEIVKERDEKRRFYDSIEKCIEECRVEYELVQEKIREAQRYLIQLSGYLQRRQISDEELIGELRKETAKMQDKLLKTQDILNSNQAKQSELIILEIETLDKQSL